MKVMLINGSPHEDGGTCAALREVEGALIAEGIGTELIHIGANPIRGCIACRRCKREQDGFCAFGDDMVNEVKRKVPDTDGFIFGAPVHYASAAGAMSSFLDRLFFSGGDFAYKPGAAVVSARRAGTTAALDQLNKYFTISNMMIVGSQYWNLVHGMNAEDVRNDFEGMMTMRTLGRNMAWLLKCIDAGKKAGVKIPEREPMPPSPMLQNKEG